MWGDASRCAIESLDEIICFSDGCVAHSILTLKSLRGLHDYLGTRDVLCKKMGRVSIDGPGGNHHPPHMRIQNQPRG